MEAIPIILLDFIIEYTLSEITQHMLSSACGWSKKKWKKIMKKINKHKTERPKEIMRRVSALPSTSQLEIMEFISKITVDIEKMKKTVALETEI